jgi:hypothetical protein
LAETDGDRRSARRSLPRGPSRLITVGYRSPSNDPTFATQLQYRETVTAGVHLSAPRRASPGRVFAFRGHLAGGYVPHGGALVSLEIFFAGPWRQIALLRTNRPGAFAYPVPSGASGSSSIHLGP